MSTPPAGWYPDPADPRAVRWFDGQQWQGAQQWQGGPPPKKRMGSGKLALIIAGSIVGTLVIVGILAAIAIPVFLNQRAKADVTALKSLTCAEVASQTVAKSKLESSADEIPLVAVSDVSLTEDHRAGLKAPAVGKAKALVMVCSGTGTWQDKVTTPVTMSVYLTSDHKKVLTFDWTE